MLYPHQGQFGAFSYIRDGAQIHLDEFKEHQLLVQDQMGAKD
jgi:hypothetical protein